MCELCTKHGEGEIWYKNARNYSQDLLSDLNRRSFIKNFLDTTIKEGYRSLGRLETLFRKSGKLPAGLIRKIEERAREEHFGQVLPLQEIRSVVLKAEVVVRMPCACRWTTAKKETRCCYGISYGPEHWYDGLDMSYFGKAGGEGLEVVMKEEALEQMQAIEQDGAIHTIWTMMTPFIGAVCNCKALDCIAMRTLSGVRIKTVEKAEHTAAVNIDLCNGCGICEQKCQFQAIHSRRDGDGLSAVVEYDRCYGCGLCVGTCSEGAISLRLK